MIELFKFYPGKVFLTVNTKLGQTNKMLAKIARHNTGGCTAKKHVPNLPLLTIFVRRLMFSKPTCFDSLNYPK